MSSPLLAACGAVALVLGLPVLTMGSVLEKQMYANESADAAALAAADALNGWIGADPCSLALTVAARYSVELESCALVEETGVATVVVSAPSAIGRIRASARAG